MRLNNTLLAGSLVLMAAGQAFGGARSERPSSYWDKTYSYDIKETIIRADGKEIYGLLYLPQEVKVKMPFIAGMHGINGTHEGLKTTAAYFAERGIAMYIFDSCGGSSRSRSSGKTTDMTLLTQEDDFRTVLEYFKKEAYVDTDALYLYGESMGGMTAALYGRDHPDEIKALFLVFPAFCIPDDWNKIYTSLDSIPANTDIFGLNLGRDFFVSIQPQNLDLWAEIPKFKRDVLIFHGTNDTIVPVSYAEKAASIYEQATLRIFPGAGHGFSPPTMNLCLGDIYSYIKSH
jgi:dienelactone hydrolase